MAKIFKQCETLSEPIADQIYHANTSRNIPLFVIFLSNQRYRRTVMAPTAIVLLCYAVAEKIHSSTCHHLPCSQMFFLVDTSIILDGPAGFARPACSTFLHHVFLMRLAKKKLIGLSDTFMY
jgi:hypothetical protein